MIRVTGFCDGNSPVIGEFPAQKASNAENVSIWWRHGNPETRFLISPVENIIVESDDLDINDCDAIKGT